MGFVIDLGQVLTRDNIVEVIKFAHREKLFIFADEVNQIQSILAILLQCLI